MLALIVGYVHTALNVQVRWKRGGKRGRVEVGMALLGLRLGLALVWVVN